MHLRYRVTCEPEWRYAPMAFWVHVPVPDRPGETEPPAPEPIPRRGYPHLRIDYRGCELVFSSPEQLRHCIDVLSSRNLPTTRRLSALRGQGAGPNGHWLSRLPASLKSPGGRRQLVRYLQAIETKVMVRRGQTPVFRVAPLA